MTTPATDVTPRLRAYIHRTQGPLDLFALLTIWLAVLPLAALPQHDNRWLLWVVGRSALSLVFGVDLALRMRYSGTPVRYAVRHPVNVLAVLFPPVRIVFSLRLLTAMFRRGNLSQFLFTAAMLLANGAVIVYAFESHAAGANIRTIGEALWWAVVTVATVGYGDYYPVTLGGRLTAAALMALGVVILAGGHRAGGLQLLRPGGPQPRRAAGGTRARRRRHGGRRRDVEAREDRVAARGRDDPAGQR